MGFYEEMAELAREVLTEFDQGATLSRKIPGVPNPATPWIPATSTTQTCALRCAVAAILADQANAKYIDGTVITVADLVVTCAVPDILPKIGDIVTLGGDDRVVKKVVQIPAAGIPVAFKLFVQG